MPNASQKEKRQKEKEEKAQKVERKIARTVNVLEEAVKDGAHDAATFLPSQPKPPSPPKPKTKPFKIVIGGFDD